MVGTWTALARGAGLEVVEKAGVLGFSRRRRAGPWTVLGRAVGAGIENGGRGIRVRGLGLVEG